MAIYIMMCGHGYFALDESFNVTARLDPGLPEPPTTRSATQWPCRMCCWQKPLRVTVALNACFISRCLAVFLLSRLHCGEFFFEIVDALLHAADFRLQVTDVEKSHILGGCVKRGTITNPG